MLTASDVAQLARLGVAGVLGLVDMLEQVHHTIGRLAPPFGRSRAGPARGISGWVYRAVRGTTRGVGGALDLGLGGLARLTPSARGGARRDAWLAALNGVLGDHLAAQQSPLAIAMGVRRDGQWIECKAEALQQAWPKAGSRVLVLVHGLCMNDLQWGRRSPHDLPSIGEDQGYTVVRIHYNTGLHIWDNAEQLAALLERLVAHWPASVRELALVGHSMGGLVARGACHAGAEAGQAWTQTLRRLICLGTPHQGAFLERGGHGLETLLEMSPYAAPVAKLTRVRSAGITDLRHGRVRRPLPAEGPRPTPTPLPEGVKVGLLAATTAERASGLRHAVLGDGMVTLASAWGEHRDRARALQVPASGKALITQADHWQLLAHPEAATVLRRWLR